MDVTAILTLALEKGLFAALFVFAFWFILTENKKREENQRDLFLSLSDSLDKTKDAVTAIEGKIERIDNNQSNVSQDIMEVKYMINSMETILKSQINKGPNK
ncbi:BhlA/UviB family holin-like peptide [Bacillus atrophaeus]|uniref:BhlA/UviB family holin-like peptide n=1 Tax=Bacillus atrophaeus TaxID=1452 RepID=UPI002E1D804D|nr:BhlA/UviB family holin-like peptide [Bacillus atrophaeus]